MQTFKLKDTDVSYSRQDMGATPRSEKGSSKRATKCEACSTPLGHSQQCPNPKCRGPRRNLNYSLRLPQMPIPVQLMRGERDGDASSPSLMGDGAPGLNSRGLGDSTVQSWKDSSYLDEVKQHTLWPDEARLAYK